MNLEERPLDVVLFGATGFTGKLVAEVLAKRTGDEGVRWAIAGRSRERLEAVRHQLAAKDEALADLPIKVADGHDVGPYTTHGIELARACARHGTSYCDLTGETNFVRRVIDECHDEARRNRARIVHCAGFDSIPSDLGAHMAWDFARRTHGEGLACVKCFTGKMKGAASGGTIASAFAIMEAAKHDRELRRLLRDPHGLDPDRTNAPKDPFEYDQTGVRFDEDIQRWTAPFVMAAINARIVRRSHALLHDEDGAGYGPSFRYNEAMSFGAGPRGFAMATAVTVGLVGFLAAIAFEPARKLLASRFLPAPGEGPSREAIESGFFEIHVLAKTESGRRLRGRVAGTRDPGYGETAKMLAETALSLAKDDPRLPQRHGVLTPATALGMRLVERLTDAGMTFDIHDA